MAAGRIKGITIEIGGDTTKLTKALANVDNALNKTKTNLRDIEKALKLNPSSTALLKDKQQELARAISETEERLKTEKEAYEQLSHADKTPENIEQMRQLKTQIDLDTEALRQLEKEARQSASVLGTQMQIAGEKVKEVGEKIKEAGDKISDFGTKMTQKVTVPIATAFGASIKSAVEWESAFTGVMKTVDETATTTYDDLKGGINELAKVTASSQNEIASTMEIAGQLGVSADDVLDFTKVMIELKDTTNLTAEEAASSLAKFANVTNMSLKDVDKLGAAIVDLGNNYATTEADIVSMATRLSGAGAQVGLTQGEIVGLATALSSVGIEAEMGGSAFSKAMIKMQVAVETGFTQVNDLTERAGMSLRDLELMSTNDTKSFKELAQSLGMTTTEIKEVITNGNNLTTFADVAGMKTEEFVKLYKDDAPGALQAFIAGLGDTETKGESTIAMLQDMGFTEVRLRDTLTRLANAHGLVTDAMEQGNKAWEDNAALENEAEKRYGTMESRLNQLKARITEVAVQIGEMLMPYVEALMGKVQEWIDKWNSLDESQKQFILKIAALVAAIGPALIIIGKIVSSIGILVKAAGTIMTGIGKLLPLIASISAPVLIVIGVITALVAAFIYFYNTNEEFRGKVQEIWENIKTAVSSFFETCKAWFDQFVEWITPLVEAITGAVSAIWEIVSTIVGMLVDFIQSKIEENRAFIEAALSAIKLIFTTVWTVIKNAVAFTLNTIKTIFTTFFNVLQNLAKAWSALLKGDWKSALEFLKTAATTALNGVKQLFTNFKDSLSNIFTGIKDSMLKWGREMIENLIKGIKEKIQGVKDAMNGVGDAIKERIHFTHPDEGPLKDFPKWAPDMMNQFAQGITDNKGVITDAVNQSFDLKPYIMSLDKSARMMANNTAPDVMSANNDVNVSVVLQGGLDRLFRAMVYESQKNQQITGQSALLGV